MAKLYLLKCFNLSEEFGQFDYVFMHQVFFSLVLDALHDELSHENGLFRIRFLCLY